MNAICSSTASISKKHFFQIFFVADAMQYLNFFEIIKAEYHDFYCFWWTVYSIENEFIAEVRF